MFAHRSRPALRLFAPALFLFATGSATLSPEAAQERQALRKLSDAARSICLADGGTVGIMGLSGNEGCVRPMPDAGKSCTDGSQCKAGCYLDMSKPGFRYPKPGRRVVGTCAATDFPFGCRTAVVDGRAAVGLCVD